MLVSHFLLWHVQNYTQSDTCTFLYYLLITSYTNMTSLCVTGTNNWLAPPKLLQLHSGKNHMYKTTTTKKYLQRLSLTQICLENTVAHYQYKK